MDVSVAGAVQAVTELTQANATQQVQVQVLKKALNMQESSAAALLQAIPSPTGDLPLATQGTLGTQLNTRA